jgi:hypothetical protein
MPPNHEAAAVTDGYRALVLELRNAAAVASVNGFDRVDLDAGRRELRRQLETWSAAAATLTLAAQRRAVDLADGYAVAYLDAAGVDSTLPELGAPELGTIGEARKPLERAYFAAGVGMLWQLGAGNGRAAATGYGGALTIRTARTAVSEAARARLADVIASHEAIVGWERVTAMRCCERCFEQAGRVYHDRHGFYAHPACHCTAEPVIRDVPEHVKRTAATVVQP